MSYFKDLINLYLKTMEGNNNLTSSEKEVKKDIIDITKKEVKINESGKSN